MEGLAEDTSAPGTSWQQQTGMSGGQPIDSLADALGQVVARERTNWQRAFAEERETWRREAERRDAEARALLAEKTVEALNLRREMDTLVQEHRDRFKEMRKEFGSAYASIERGFADAFGRNVDKLTVLYDRVETKVSELQEVRADVFTRVDDVTARLDDRLATVRDGRDADPAQFEALAASLSERVDARLAMVRDGRDADPAQFDALADAVEQRVGRSLAEMEATADAGRDGLDALMQSLAEKVDAKLAAVRDGRDADPAPIAALARALEEKVDHRLAAVRDGKDSDPAQFEALAAALTDKVDARLATVRDGKDVDPAEVERLGASLRQDLADALADVREQLRADPSLKGEPGKPGEPGKLPAVKDWTRGVHYAGDVVTCGGSLWQASRDTGEPPGHDDWTVLATKGQDAKEFEPRGLYDPDAQYERLNIVAMDGGSYVALRDEPGPCPGDGWRLLVSRGKPGKPGEPGPKSTEPGPRGDPGVGIADIDIVPESFALVVTFTDGHVMARDVRPWFEAYNAQVRE